MLRVLNECNIGYYLVLDSTYTPDDNVSNLVRHPYWFPDEDVSAGDLVVLYTKAGKQSVKHNKNGSSSHFFYRGLDKTVWNQTSDCAVVLEIASWTSKEY